MREILNAPGDLDADAVARVRELFDALDDWIGRGGFLPDDWKRAATAAAMRRQVFAVHDGRERAGEALVREGERAACERSRA